MRRMLAIFIALGFLASANAEEFDWEVTLDGSRVESEFGSTVFGTDGFFGVRSEVDTLSLGANWFIDGLVIGDQPRSEAAFLNRASSLSFAYERADVDTTVFGIGADGATDNFSTDALSIGGRYVWEESGWFATGAYASSG